MTDVLPWIVPSALLLIGSYLAISSMRDLWFGFASSHWPSTTGEVTEVFGHQGSVHAGDSAVVVCYRYSVAGTEYESKRFDYAGRNVEGGQRRVMARYHVGRKVPVYYDPTKPSRAVLAVGVSTWSYAPIVLGVVLVVVALAWLGVGAPSR